MQLTDHGRNTRDRLAGAYQLPSEAAEAMMQAVAHGGGFQAQFTIPELGGMGQWSRGGMTMVGDMFNTGLQARVASLCEDIAQAGEQGALFERAAPQPQGSQSQSQGVGQGGFMGFASWWPEDLGQPASQGSQNDMSYAIFPDRQRLAMNIGGRVTLHDTGDHMISGVSQQQGSGTAWLFTSQHGTVSLSDLPVIGGDAPEPKVQAAPTPEAQPTPAPEDVTAPQAPAPSPSGHGMTDPDQILSTLQKLGALHEAGILSDEEFSAKKADLLSRL